MHTGEITTWFIRNTDFQALDNSGDDFGDDGYDRAYNYLVYIFIVSKI